MRKIRQRIFILFNVKELLTTGKILKAANSASKGSASSPLQITVLARYGAKAGITPK